MLRKTKQTQQKPLRQPSSSMVVEPPSSSSMHFTNDEVNAHRRAVHHTMTPLPQQPNRSGQKQQQQQQQQLQQHAITSADDLMRRMNMLTSSALPVLPKVPPRREEDANVRSAPEKVREATTDDDEYREASTEYSSNTMTHAAAMAGVWAVDRMIDKDDAVAEEDEDEGGREKGKLTSFVMPKEPQELIKILHQFVGPELLESQYVPDFVMRDITETTGWAVATFRFVHEGVGVNLCVVSTYEDMTVKQTHHDMLRTLMFGIDCVSKLTSAQPQYHMPDSISVTCLLTEHDREMPVERATPLDVENVNAGVTLLSDTPPRRVLVYRRQHARKVMLHELVHCMGLDAPLRAPGMEDEMEDAEQAVATRLNYGSSSGELLSGEAYCEVLACYWHMYLHVPETLKRGGGAVDAVQAVKQLWRRERSHYLQVSALILMHFSEEEEMYDDGDASERVRYNDEDDILLDDSRHRRSDETSTYATTLKDKMDAAIQHVNRVLRRRSKQTTTDKAGRDLKNKEEAKVAMRAVRSAEMQERTHVLSYFFAKAALWDRLGQLPATVLEEQDARRFWELYRKALTSTRFWTDVARSRAAAALSMTSLDDYDDQ